MEHAQLFATFAAVLALAGAHLLSGVIPETGQGKSVRSFAGGIALSYVFLHILPDMAKYESEVLQAIRRPVLPWFEEHIYVAAMLGLVFSLGMRSRPDRHDRIGFRNDLLSSSMRNLLTGYTFAQQQSILWPLLLLAVAFGAHYWQSDRSILEHYGDRYRRTGPALLAAAVIGGWITGALFRLPVRPVAWLFAFLAGGIILNTIRDELPQKTARSFTALCLGLVMYSLVLLFVFSGMR